MRLTIVMLALAATGCSTTPENTEAQTAERCTVEECFRPRDVRRVEVLDEQNIIVYSGPRECPFRIEVRGFACRLDFAFDMTFVQREPGSSITRDRERYSTPQRICGYTPRVEVYTGVFDPGRQVPIGGIDNPAPGEECRVVDVDSLTDDELVELYVDRRLAPPPPPVGGGRLETPEQGEGDAEPAVQQEPGTAGEAGSEDEPAAGQGAEVPARDGR